MLFESNSAIKDKVFHFIKNGCSTVIVQFSKHGEYYEVELLLMGTHQAKAISYSYHLDREDAFCNAEYLLRVVTKWAADQDVQVVGKYK